MFIDNVSTDHSPFIIPEILEGKVKYGIWSQDRVPGPYAGINMAIGLSNEPNVIIIDADVELEDNFVEAMAYALSNYMVAFPFIKEVTFSHSLSRYMTDYQKPGATKAIGYRRSIFSEFGRFEETITGSDAILFHSVIAKYPWAMASTTVRHFHSNTIWKLLRKYYRYGTNWKARWSLEIIPETVRLLSDILRAVILFDFRALKTALWRWLCTLAMCAGNLGKRV